MAAEGGGGATALWLPGDVIFNILSWAPVKSVCRFRCVYKDWLALISDPDFVLEHKFRAAPETRFVASFSGGQFCCNTSGVQVMDMKGNVVKAIKGLGVLPTVLSSLDNLIAVCCRHNITRVVDVITGKVLLTCPCPNPYMTYGYTIRLGRAPNSRLCKMVRLTQRLVHREIQQTCEVLTFGDGVEWRQAQSPPAFVSIPGEESVGATVNGVVHFISKPTDETPAPLISGDRVLCFNLDSEEWAKTIQSPLKEDTELWSNTGRICITELDDSLCMVQTEVSQTNLWLLVDPDNSIWVKAYVILMTRPFDVYQPLWMMPDGVKLLLYYSCFAPSRVVGLRVYDPSVGTCTEVMEMPKHSGTIGVCNLHLDHFVTAQVGST